MLKSLEFLRSQEQDYQPNERVTEQLGSITMLPLVGPFLVGKTTLMRNVVEENADFGRVQGFTTRKVRPGEAPDEYFFLPHSESTVESIAERVRSGDLVQYAVHPTTGRVYGSEGRDYHKPYMLLDTLSGAVAGLQRLPFKEVVVFGVVTSTDEWMARFQTRPAEPEERKKRVREGITSLEWLLDQQGIGWIDNNQGNLFDAGRQVVATALGTRDPEATARPLAERLLKHLITLA